MLPASKGMAAGCLACSPPGCSPPVKGWPQDVLPAGVNASRGAASHLQRWSSTPLEMQSARVYTSRGANGEDVHLRKCNFTLREVLFQTSKGSSLNPKSHIRFLLLHASPCFFLFLPASSCFGFLFFMFWVSCFSCLPVFLFGLFLFFLFSCLGFSCCSCFPVWGFPVLPAFLFGLFLLFLFSCVGFSRLPVFLFGAFLFFLFSCLGFSCSSCFPVWGFSCFSCFSCFPVWGFPVIPAFLFGVFLFFLFSCLGLSRFSCFPPQPHGRIQDLSPWSTRATALGSWLKLSPPSPGLPPSSVAARRPRRSHAHARESLLADLSSPGSTLVGVQLCPFVPLPPSRGQQSPLVPSPPGRGRQCPSVPSPPGPSPQSRKLLNPKTPNPQNS